MFLNVYIACNTRVETIVVHGFSHYERTFIGGVTTTEETYFLTNNAKIQI